MMITRKKMHHIYSKIILSAVADALISDGLVIVVDKLLHQHQGLMAFLQSSAYCPTQRAYAMTLTNTAYQTSVAAGASGYQSLYSEERRDLDLLDVRKETFIFYPKSSVATQDMAAAGFYYTGEAYVVKCFCCKLTVTRFNGRDSPFAVHRSRAPDCPFVRKTVTQGGVPEVEPQPGREEDTVDGFSLNSDVEDDGPSQDQLVPRGLPMKDVAMTAKAAKPLRPAAPTSKSSHLQYVDA